MRSSVFDTNRVWWHFYCFCDILHSRIGLLTVYCHISLTLLHFNCSQKKHLEFKEILIHQEPGNLPHELTDRDSRPECDIAPRIWHGGRTEDVPGIARCPLTSLRVSRGCSVSRLSERRDRISPRPDTLVTISELGSLKAKSNHFLLDLIVIHIVCLLFIH